MKSKKQLYSISHIITQSLAFFMIIPMAVSCVIHEDSEICCSPPPFEYVFEGAYVSYHNLTSEDVTLRAYTMHTPAHYASTKDTSAYVNHTRKYGRGKYSIETKRGPALLDSSLSLYQTIVVKAGDTTAFKVESDYRPVNYMAEGPAYDVGTKSHLFATFDAVYAYPQLDSMSVEFANGKTLPFALIGKKGDINSVYTGLSPNILNERDYSDERIEIKTTDTSYHEIYVYRYYITPSHEKLAR